MSTATITRKAEQYTVVCDGQDRIIAVVAYNGTRVEYREPYVELPLFGKLTLKGGNIKYLKRAIKMKLPIDITTHLCYTYEERR